ncbi:MAG: autotransporter outer membrane beta-barrel domain-containing protein [Terrimicrobiaceae bacterium]|nr:autotransporter outer membrane beta-barrel domain-containing protein [Terrimicrobiaceae bacterium]
MISLRDSGASSVGLASRDEGTFIRWTNSTIRTSGEGSAGAFANSGSAIALRGGSILTDGTGLKIRSASLSATDAMINVRKGIGALILDSSKTNPASLRLSGGSLTAGSDAFRVRDAVAAISIENDARIRAGIGGNLLNVTSASRTSAVTFEARGVALAGDIVSDSASATAVSLADRTQLSGRIQSASVQLDSTSAWTATGDSSLRSLSLKPGGVVQFAAPTGAGFKHLVIRESLSGAGNFGMNVDLGRRKGDEITLESRSSGTHTLAVTNRGAAQTHAGEALRVVNTADGRANFKLAGGRIESGMLAYRLLRGDGQSAAPDPTDWYLANLTTGAGGADAPELSAVGRAIVNTAGAQALTWLSELDTLSQRMGELRLGLSISDSEKREVTTKDAQDAKDQKPPAPVFGSGGDVWVRGFGRRMNADTGLTGSAFSQYVYGTDLGIDKAFRLASSWLVTGLYGGWGGASRFFDSGSTGLTESIHGGLYATWLADSGWYLDGVGKLNYFDNRFDAISNLGENSRGHYGNWGFGFSLEGGRQFQLGGGWFIEPQAQAAYTHLSSADYTTSDDIAVRLVGADVFQMRAGVSAGKRLSTPWGILQPFVKAAWVQTLSDGGNLSAAGYAERPNLDGAGVQAGAGLAMQVSQRVQFYGEYQFVAAERYTQPWSVNGGFRWQW